MRYWVAVIAVALGGCYSPSINTCALACANGNACPDGFSCSNGRCATEGTTCAPDSDAAIDSNSPSCGDHSADEGEICFKDAQLIPTMVSGGVYDAQFVDVNADMHLDLVYLTPTGFEFRYNVNNVFEDPEGGPRIVGAKRFRAANVNGQAGDELVAVASGTGGIQVFGYSGAPGWALGGQADGEDAEVQGMGVGNYSPATPTEFVVAYPNKVRFFRMNGALSFAEIGTGRSFSDNIRDLASGDFDSNNRLELAISTTTGITVEAIGQTGTFAPFGNPNVPLGTSAVANGDIDHDGDPDLFYVIPSVGGPGQLGVAVWNQSTLQWMLPTTQEIPKLLFPMDAADVNNDRLADAIVAFQVGNGPVQIGIALGAADGTLSPAKAYPLPSAVEGVTQINAKEDFNGDGIPDIAITSSMKAQISILESDP